MTNTPLSPLTKRDLTLSVSRVLNAPRELVFDVTSQAKHVPKWWNSDTTTLTICEIDLRVGGAWRYSAQVNESGAEFTLKGTYLEVARPEKIVRTQTHGVEPSSNNEVLITLTYEDLGEKTRFTNNILFPSPEAYDGAVASSVESGMNAIIDRLAARLEELQR